MLGAGEPRREQSDRDLLKQRTEYLLARRDQDDALMWQAPALAMTAQAFLLTVALDDSKGRTALVISSGLALVTALASLYLIGRKRHQARVDEKEIEKLSKELDVDNPAMSLTDRARLVGHDLPAYFRPSAAVVWVAALAIFLLADGYLLVLACLLPRHVNLER